MADPKQIERLAKVRRLARENPSKEEGAAARGKLAELMLKHGVTDRDMDLFEGRAPAFAPAPPPVTPPPFDGEFDVEIMPGSPFGQVFGFGFGFRVNLTPNTGTSSAATGAGSATTSTGSATTSTGWSV